MSRLFDTLDIKSLQFIKSDKIAYNYCQIPFPAKQPFIILGEREAAMRPYIEADQRAPKHRFDFRHRESIFRPVNPGAPINVPKAYLRLVVIPDLITDNGRRGGSNKLVYSVRKIVCRRRWMKPVLINARIVV